MINSVIIISLKKLDIIVSCTYRVQIFNKFENLLKAKQVLGNKMNLPLSGFLRFFRNSSNLDISSPKPQKT